MQERFVRDIHSAKLRRQSGGGWGNWNFWGTLIKKRNEAEKELKNTETWQMLWVDHLKFVCLFVLLYFTLQYCIGFANPEPPSHLPPHTISLGHPSAPAPSILYPASNLDWQFVSYMILYMFQCHSRKSSHPLPLPESQSLFYTSVFLSLSHIQGYHYNLSKFHIYVLVYCIGGEGNGTSLQHSCLENPIDGGAWWAAVHGVAKSWTRLSDFTFTFHFSCIGEGNGNPLHCSCLENLRDGGCRLWGCTESDTT